MSLRSLSKVTVVSAGTPERATKNLVDPSARYLTHSVLIQVLPTNTGNIYVGLFGEMNKAAYTELLAILPVPTANSIQSYSATLNLVNDTIDVSEIGIDADFSGEGVIVSVLRA